MMNNNILITGGLGGIGIEICKFFIEKNYNLIIVDNQPINNFNKIFSKHFTKKNIKNILYKKVDLSKPIKIKKMFKILSKKFSSIDILINSAGIQHISSIEKFSE